LLNFEALIFEYEMHIDFFEQKSPCMQCVSKLPGCVFVIFLAPKQ